MPHFTREDSRYFVSYITGPSHVRLGLSLAASATAPVMVRVANPTAHSHGNLDEEKIRQAVINAVARVTRHMNQSLNLAEIVYREGDSPRYDLYEYCAVVLLERILNGGAEEEI